MRNIKNSFLKSVCFKMYKYLQNREPIVYASAIPLDNQNILCQSSLQQLTHWTCNRFQWASTCSTKCSVSEVLNTNNSYSSFCGKGTKQTDVKIVQMVPTNGTRLEIQNHICCICIFKTIPSRFHPFPSVNYTWPLSSACNHSLHNWLCIMHHLFQ